MYGTYLRLGVAVWDSPCTVIRAARGRLLRLTRRKRKYRKARHDFYDAMLRHHREAAALYKWS